MPEEVKTEEENKQNESTPTQENIILTPEQWQQVAGEINYLRQQLENKQAENYWEKEEARPVNLESLQSDFEHRAWLLTSRFVDKEGIKLHDLLLKELSLSYLPDAEIAYIYSAKMDCVEEWLSMGMEQLAKQRLTHLLIRLAIMKSVNAKERMLQAGGASTMVNIEGEEFQRLEDEVEPQGPRGPGFRPNLGGVVSLIRQIRPGRRFR
jgi:hypothetical protein